MLQDALTYPVRKDGWIMILGGAVLALVIDLLGFLPVIGLAAGLFSLGYFSAFYLSIVRSTMTGNDVVPEWPEFTNFREDILEPAATLFFLFLLSSIPGAAVWFLVPHQESWFFPALGAGIGLGILYFPMSVLGLCGFGGWQGSLPHVVLPAIFRSLPEYLLCVALLLIGTALVGAASFAVTAWSYLAWPIATAVGLYNLMAQARLFGLLFRKKAEQFSWYQ